MAYAQLFVRFDPFLSHNAQPISGTGRALETGDFPVKGQIQTVRAVLCESARTECHSENEEYFPHGDDL
jgi:hypothetical protein